MKTQRRFSSKRGFTLMELMVAMAITTIIVTVLVSITSIAIDTWNRSRNELRAARQGKAMIETMARDFESLVTRRGNENEWLYAKSDPPGDSSNAAELIFFTAATDRYDGDIGQTADMGGDVSCVGYRLLYRDPIDGGTSQNQTFVLNRYLVNPDETFENLLGEEDLDNAFGSYSNELEEVENFICENIYQFTVTFYVQVTRGSGSSVEVLNIPVSVSPKGSDSFRILGTGIEADDVDGATTDEVKAGRLTAVQISLTVLTDSGVDLIRRNQSFATDAAFIGKNSYQYSKLVQLPSM